MRISKIHTVPICTLIPIGNQAQTTALLVGINSINYFLYDDGPQSDPHPPPSELLHLNQTGV